MTKLERASAALAHQNLMYTKYSKAIAKQIEETKIYNYNDKILSPREENNFPSIYLRSVDTTTVLMQEATKGKKICALNFASYRYPGGGFIKGSLAQEESLCHESTLYSVLKTFNESFYEWNRHNLNHSLYYNRALYTPNVIFEKGGRVAKADVLTCAAPNFKAASRYVEKESNLCVLSSRIEFMYAIAAINKVETLIAGAWGCGVFGQDPKEVCELLTIIPIAKQYASIKKIIFAVPNSTSRNYKAFEEVITKYNTTGGLK